MNALTHLGGGVFRWVLQTTWQAAVLAGLILLAQWLLRKRLSAGWRYGLWLLLVVRLLMPAPPQSAFSIFNLARNVPANPFPSGRYAGGPIDPYFTVNSFNGSPSTNIYTKPIEAPPLPIPPSVVIKPTVKVDWFRLAFYGWLTGVCFFGARLLWTNARFRSRIAGHQPIGDETVTRVFDECRAALKITEPVRLIESDEVESPAVYGLWRKWLLLPDGALERFTTEELRCIVLHELAHIKRGDLGVNWLVSVLQVVHWFNPALWLAFARMRADRELATDALALSHVAATENVAYGETILKIVENLAKPAGQTGLVGIAESKAGLKDRLRRVAQFGTARQWRWAAVAVAVTVVGVGLTDARQPAATVVSVTHGDSNRAISGTVVGPDGRPIANVQLALFQHKSRRHATGDNIGDSDIYLTGQPLLFNPASGHIMGEPRLVPWNYCITDRNGRFYLDDLEGTLFLLAANARGFARIATNEFSTNMTVKLEPWGRIEGALWHYDEVVPDETVVARVLFDDGTIWSRGTRFETKTDRNGGFSINYVPPGQYGVFGSTLREAVVVKPGKTDVVKLGGSGRPVIGRFNVRNPYVQIEWSNQFCCFSTAPPRPAKPFKTKQDYEVWRSLPEVKHSIDGNNHYHQVHCAKDGSFRIDEVAPGNYEMVLVVSNPQHPLNIESPKFIGGYDGYDGTFAIPASQPNTRESFDVGFIEISLKPHEASGAVPLNNEPAPTNDPSPPKRSMLRGTVVLPDGTPAANAEIGLKIPGQSLRIGDRELVTESGAHGDTRTDAQGAFTLPMRDVATAVCAVHDAGFAKLSREELTNGVKIILQPWGQVEGVLRLNRRPAADEMIELDNYAPDLWDFTSRIRTDAHGRFVFADVPAGDCELARCVGFANGWRRARPIHFEVRSGETTNVTWGGNGRPVVGKCVVEHVNDLPQHLSLMVSIHTPYQLTGPPPDLISPRQITAWMHSEAGQKGRNGFRSFDASAKADGSFQVDDVAPGAYEVSFQFEDIPIANSSLGVVRVLSSQPQKIVVPPLADPENSEPFDLGIVKPSFGEAQRLTAVPDELKAGDSAPPFETKTLSGQPLRLNDYRGKYVLVDLEYTFPGLETEKIQAVHESFAQDDRFVVITLSEEEDENFVKYLSSKGYTHWIQGDMGFKPSGNPYQPDSDHLPMILLIDPQGKIVATRLRGQAIQSTVAKALAGR